MLKEKLKINQYYLLLIFLDLFMEYLITLILRSVKKVNLKKIK